ncbi:MAG: hypothetical protein ACXADH_12985 [Candidatus Kariarchaeaceae archaeon]
MKKSIIIFVAAITFITPGIAAHAGKQVDESGIPSGKGFPSGHHYNLNITDKQEQFTCPPPDYIDGKQVCKEAVFIPRDESNDPLSREVSLW